MGAVNSYHEVVPPAHFEKLLGRRALQDYNSIHAASQGNIGSGGPLGLWARSAEARSRRQPCSQGKQVCTPSHPTSQSTTPTQKAIPSRTAVDQPHCQWASII